MISVVIPTLNAEDTLASCVAALVPAVVEGLVQETIVVDGGSIDATCAIAEATGVRLIRAERGRGSQLGTGAAVARGDWLLFLHADTVLQPGWEEEAGNFIERVKSGRRAQAAAAFRFALDDEGLMPRLLESLVSLRCLLFALPYGDQGLLISRALYARLGGFRPLPLMEDVDIVRRLRRDQRAVLQSSAVTSARRYRHDGYLSRMLQNGACMTLYCLRVPARMLVRLYG
jgi:rSAM/selenodomain-associated transferase 2